MKNSKHIFYKLFYTILSIVIILSLFNFISLYFINKKLVKNLTSQQYTYINSYSKHLDNLLNNIQNLIFYIDKNDTLTTLASSKNNSNINNVKLSKDIFKQLGYFKSFNTEIADVYIYLHNFNYLYTSSGITLLNTYFNNRYDGDYDKWLDYLTQTSTFKLTTWDLNIRKNNYSLYAPLSKINITKSLYNSYNLNKEIGIIIFNLKDSFIQSLFKDIPIAEGNLIYICDLDNNIISSNTDIPIQDIIDNEDINSFNNQSKFIKNRGIVTKQFSNHYNLTYIVFTPSEKITQPIHNIFKFVNILLILISAILIIWTYIISKKLYSPINSITQSLSTIHYETDILYKNETDFIQQSISNIIKANESLESLIKTSRSLITDSIIINILIGGFNSQVNDLSKQYNIKLSDGYYNSIVVVHELLIEHDEALLKKNHSNFIKILKEYLHDSLFSCVITGINEYTVVVKCNNYDEINNIKSTLEKLPQKFEEILPYYSFYIGIGNFYNGIDKLKESYQQSRHAIEYRNCNYTGNIIYYDKNIKQDSYSLPFSFYNEFHAILSKKDFNQALIYITNILNFNLNKDISMSSYISLCKLINNFLNSFYRKSNHTEKVKLIRILPNTYVYNIHKLKDVITFNMNFILNNNSSKSTKNTLINKIIDYIEINFNQNINLSTVSDYLGYNPNYLSRYFKENQGICFTDYLNQKKVTYAKEMLLTTDKTIKQIGKNAGFNSTPFFIKVFNKYTGLTPGDFREKYKEQYN